MTTDKKVNITNTAIEALMAVTQRDQELSAVRDQIAALVEERDQVRKERDDYYNEMMQSALDVLIALRERDEARAMSAAWKRAAKVYRTLYVSPFPFLEAVESDPDVTRMLFEAERAEG